MTKARCSSATAGRGAVAKPDSTKGEADGPASTRALRPSSRRFSGAAKAAASLRPGAGEADLLAASDALREAFLKLQPGFIRRAMLRAGEGGSTCRAVQQVPLLEPSKPHIGN